MTALSEALDFDHVIEILPDGTWRDAPAGIHAPEAYNPDSRGTTLEGWELPLSGLTGQHGYSGPWLHDSEIIAGAVEREILARPGYWVAIYATYDACEECGGAGVTGLDDNGDEVDCTGIIAGTCEPGATLIEGWTVAFREAGE